MDAPFRQSITRRRFLAGAAAGGAAFAVGGLDIPAHAHPDPGPDEEAPWFEATIPQLQALLASGALTSRTLTQAYLRRIADLNPLLGAVIETNPRAIGIASRLDEERRNGLVRGPLHGIPILLKDNIATDDGMQTTAGSLALVGSKVHDATITTKLREAGALLLGKANLSEWANFRGFAPFNGWSARGGFTRNPYVLDWDPCGSSSGSAVAPAANLCAAAVGTETDGSIVCPSGNNHVVGLKPTLGLISQQGIIPIAHSQDTAGPMTRTVTDTAVLLNVLRSPFGPVLGHGLPDDYTAFLQRGALAGARIGVDRREFERLDLVPPEIVASVEAALVVMADLGATIVGPVDTPDPDVLFETEFTVLLHEFKFDIAAYLATVRRTRMRTLADLIRFNRRHCEEEMKYFGQEIFELSEATSGDPNDPAYLAARALSLQMAREDGIDRVFAVHDLDAVVAPSYSFASSPPAVAGYPSIALPVGIAVDGRPAGMLMYARFLEEPKLLAFAYDLEQELQPRQFQPQFLSSVPPEPPDAGICAALDDLEAADVGAAATRLAEATAARPRAW